MAIFSIAAGFLALVLTVAGVMFSPSPNLGAAFSLLSVLAAMAGIVSGGLGISRAKYDGRSTSTATMGLVLSVLVFFPALLFGLTCGLCNAAMSAESRNPTPAPFWLDAGVRRDLNRVDGGVAALGPNSPPVPNTLPDPNTPPDPDTPADPSADSPPPAFPPPAFPPPPFP